MKDFARITNASASGLPPCPGLHRVRVRTGWRPQRRGGSCKPRRGRKPRSVPDRIEIESSVTPAAPVGVPASPHSGTSKGEVALTLSYLWDFVILRIANFQRLKVAI